MFCSIVKLEVKAGHAVGQTYPVGETFHEQALSLIFQIHPMTDTWFHNGKNGEIKKAWQQDLTNQWVVVSNF